MRGSLVSFKAAHSVCVLYFRQIQFGGNMWESPKGQATIIQLVFTFYFGASCSYRGPFGPQLTEAGLLLSCSQWRYSVLVLLFIAIFNHIWLDFIGSVSYLVVNVCLKWIVKAKHYFADEHKNGQISKQCSYLHTHTCSWTDTHAQNKYEQLI